MYEEIVYEVCEPLATLTLNRPQRLNAWTERMGREIKHALASAEADPLVVVIIITGGGRGFCAGADLQTLDALSRGRAPVPGADELPSAEPGDPTVGPSFRGTFSYPMSIAKPIIGAINGPCVGLGMPIALSCDIRFASDRAVFSTAFARRGLIAEWGMSWLLPRIIGVAHAMDALLSARSIGAHEAQQIGLVNRVVPHDDLLHVTRAYALDIATHCSPRSLAVIKRQTLQHLSGSMAEAEEDAFGLMLESLAREDFAEGLGSFHEKRAPRFPRIPRIGSNV